MKLATLWAVTFVLFTGSEWVFSFLVMWYLAILVEYAAIKFLKFARRVNDGHVKEIFHWEG